MKKRDINEKLIGVNIYALYKDGEFTTTKNLKKGWMMLIDIGRHRCTIVQNMKKHSEVIEFHGEMWKKSKVPYDGTYLIIDHEWNVCQSIKVTESDFANVKSGYGKGIMEMVGRNYMNKAGEFIHMK